MPQARRTTPRTIADRSDPPASLAVPHTADEAAFARHETFAPRFGWLKKGFDAAAEDSQIFLREDAPVQLGVGKNMARAVRYWCHAFKLLEDLPIKGQRATASRPSAFGNALLRDGGWDPFLEDVASLWYLHWKLIQAPCEATAWRFAFTQFPDREFSIDRMQSALRAYVERVYPGARTVDASLRKDALCIARMYGPSEVGPVTEDSIHCPFSELRLLTEGIEPKSFAFDIGDKPGLPDAIVAAACLEYAATASPGASTISVSRLLSEPGSPGLAFKLSEAALMSALERVASSAGVLALSDTAGVLQLSFRPAPVELANDFLAAHFSKNNRGTSR